jgi:hypothetical protein
MSTENEEKSQSIIFGMNKIVCVCGHCGWHDNNNVVMEFNFREQSVIYLCSNCKKENRLVFGKDKPAPYPRARIGPI